MELMDIQTSKIFPMNGFTDEVTLVDAMAVWCPDHLVQGSEVKTLHHARERE
jgi:hypothetical protein